MVTGTIKSQGEKQPKSITQFAMVKNFVGGMAVTVEAYDFSAPARTINFNFNQEKNVPTSKMGFRSICYSRRFTTNGKRILYVWKPRRL